MSAARAARAACAACAAWHRGSAVLVALCSAAVLGCPSVGEASGPERLLPQQCACCCDRLPSVGHAHFTTRPALTPTAPRCVLNVCQAGNELLCAGYTLYSSSTILVLTVGEQQQTVSVSGM